MTAMLRSFACLAAVALVSLAAPSALRAQPAPEGARLTGRVTDGSGAALPGVTVTVRPSRGAAATTLVTDGVGQYVSPVLPPDVYAVSFELTGFESRTRSAVELRQGELFILDQQLGLASLAETVQVIADAPCLLHRRHRRRPHRPRPHRYNWRRRSSRRQCPCLRRCSRRCVVRARPATPV